MNLQSTVEDVVLHALHSKGVATHNAKGKMLSKTAITNSMSDLMAGTDEPFLTDKCTEVESSDSILFDKDSEQVTIKSDTAEYSFNNEGLFSIVGVSMSRPKIRRYKSNGNDLQYRLHYVSRGVSEMRDILKGHGKGYYINEFVELCKNLYEETQNVSITISTVLNKTMSDVLRSIYTNNGTLNPDNLLGDAELEDALILRIKNALLEITSWLDRMTGICKLSKKAQESLDVFDVRYLLSEDSKESLISLVNKVYDNYLFTNTYLYSNYIYAQMKYKPIYKRYKKRSKLLSISYTHLS